MTTLTQPSVPTAPADHGIVDERRATRADGWTVEVQIAFIDALRASGSVAAACRAVGRGTTSAYRLRERSESFAKAWASATRFNALDLERIAMERAVDGLETVYFDADGKRTQSRRRQSAGELNMMLRAAMPEKYGTPQAGMRAGATAERGPKPWPAAPGGGYIHQRIDRATGEPLSDLILFDGSVADAQRILDLAIEERIVVTRLTDIMRQVLSALGFNDSIAAFFQMITAAPGEAKRRLVDCEMWTGDPSRLDVMRW